MKKLIAAIKFHLLSNEERWALIRNKATVHSILIGQSGHELNAMRIAMIKESVDKGDHVIVVGTNLDQCILKVAMPKFTNLNLNSKRGLGAQLDSHKHLVLDIPQRDVNKPDSDTFHRFIGMYEGYLNSILMVEPQGEIIMGYVKQPKRPRRKIFIIDACTSEVSTTFPVICAKSRALNCGITIFETYSRINKINQDVFYSIMANIFTVVLSPLKGPISGQLKDYLQKFNNKLKVGKLLVGGGNAKVIQHDKSFSIKLAL